MKSLRNIFIAFIGILIFTSCEDVIELELKDTTPRIIIEATLSITTQTAQVFFTKSNGFYDSAIPVTVSDANVVLQNEFGISVTLSEMNPGVYIADNVLATPGEKWTIEVESEDVSYTATTIAPYPATLDTLITEIEERPFGGGTEIRMFAEWEDEENIQNFYRLRPYQNDTLITQAYNLTNDDFSDGERITTPIMQEFDTGTLIKMELLSVDENYYRYFLELSSVVGNGFNGSNPYNPIGNFDNDALGYFGIFSVSEKEVQL